LLAAGRMSRPTAETVSVCLALAIAGCGASDGSSEPRDAAAPVEAGGLDRVSSRPTPVDAPAGTRTNDGAAEARSDGAESDAPDGMGALDGGGMDGLGALDGGGMADGGAGFAGCPGAGAYAGNPTWRDALTIAAPAPVLCAYWEQSDGQLDPNSTDNRLRATLAKKAMVTIAPGRYPLLDSDGQADVTLPLCLLQRDGKTVSVGAGTVERGPINNARGFTLTFPVPSLGQLTMLQYSAGAGPFEFKSLGDLRLCPGGASCFPGQLTFFEACTIGASPSRQLVSLDGGAVELTVTFDSGRIGAGTEPATFVSARGTFRGVAFDQRDYFKLVYSPENHHFVQHFAVFFDAPIQGACGLELVNVSDSSSVRRRPRAWTVDCQLTRLDEVAVTSMTAAASALIRN
jgi:hypothetical protein